MSWRWRKGMSFHNVVRHRDSRRVFEQFPDTPDGKRQAIEKSRKRNRNPQDIGPYHEDELVVGEEFYDEDGVMQKHAHKEKKL